VSTSRNCINQVLGGFCVRLTFIGMLCLGKVEKNSTPPENRENYFFG
jgi:hypothetical protein